MHRELKARPLAHSWQEEIREQLLNTLVSRRYFTRRVQVDSHNSKTTWIWRSFRWISRIEPKSTFQRHRVLTAAMPIWDWRKVHKENHQSITWQWRQTWTSRITWTMATARRIKCQCRNWTIFIEINSKKSNSSSHCRGHLNNRMKPTSSESYRLATIKTLTSANFRSMPQTISRAISGRSTAMKWINRQVNSYLGSSLCKWTCRCRQTTKIMLRIYPKERQRNNWRNYPHSMRWAAANKR